MSVQARCFHPMFLRPSEAVELAADKKSPHRNQRTQRGGKSRFQQSDQPRRVLIFGRLFELALYRAEVLRSRGFSVVTPKTKAEAIAEIGQGEFDAVVLSYTLSSDTAEEIVELARQKCPECPLITISNSGEVDRKLRPDVVVAAEQGPAGLIKALQQVFRTQ
jgi:CheY-like chemotaxis protein